MKPRVLVVRSGNRPFVSMREVDVIERVSHRTVPWREGEISLDRPVDLVIFTSQVAVESLFADRELAARFRRAVEGARVAAVGPATRECLARVGVETHDVASGSSQDLLDRVPADLSGRRVLWPRGLDASPELPEELARRGAEVIPLVLYRKVPVPAESDLGREILENPFSAFCATAPSAGRWLFAGLGPVAKARLRRTPAVALGPATRSFLESLAVERVYVPHPASFREAARLLESLAGKRITA